MITVVGTTQKESQVWGVGNVPGAGRGDQGHPY